MKFVSIILPAIMAALLMSACRDNAESSPALQLQVDPAVTAPVEIEYSLYNDPLDTQILTVQPDSTGFATFSPDFPDGISDFDATIFIGNEHHIAHIERGQTLNVSITADTIAGNSPAITFSGKNAGISRMLTSVANGFSLRDYFMHEKDSLPALSSIIAGIDRECQGYISGLDSITDTPQRNYYTRYLTRHADAVKLSAINIHSNITQSQPDTVAEYRRIMASIDPDDGIDVRTDLYSHWLHNHNPARGSYDFTAYMIANLQLIDSAMADPVNRRLAFSATAANFSSSMGLSREQLGMLDEAFSKYAADIPDLIEKTSARIQELSKVLTNGDKLPFDPILEAPDGQEVKLSTLYGKILYIDFWATWCGPCRAEIPYMDKLYGHFKDNPKIKLVSISVDTDQDAWRAMIKKDHPGWPQYHLPEDENKRLSKALNIEGIPRFIIIAPDGTLQSTFAPRPSDGETVDMLEKILRNN